MLPSNVPTVRPTPIAAMPTVKPTNQPTQGPPDKLCVDFQYVVRNQVGLDADAIFNEDDNSVLQGLRIATRNITIEILNGTYPGRRFLVHDLIPIESQRAGESHHLRMLAHKGVDARKLDELGKDQGSTSVGSSRYGEGQGQGKRRQLAYYTDNIPVTINSVSDNPLCAGSAQNPRIMCAIVSSTVCVVLEDSDDPNDARALMIAGLRQAVDSGDFLRRIPAQDLQMA